MMGWRARLGFLVPPGNPTVEPEMAELTPPGVSLHFTRMMANGPAGTHTGQKERNLSQVESIPACVELLAMVSPSVIVMAQGQAALHVEQIQVDRGFCFSARAFVDHQPEFGGSFAKFVQRFFQGAGPCCR